MTKQKRQTRSILFIEDVTENVLVSCTLYDVLNGIDACGFRAITPQGNIVKGGSGRQDQGPVTGVENLTLAIESAKIPAIPGKSAEDMIMKIAHFMGYQGKVVSYNCIMD